MFVLDFRLSETSFGTTGASINWKLALKSPFLIRSQRSGVTSEMSPVGRYLIFSFVMFFVFAFELFFFQVFHNLFGWINRIQRPTGLIFPHRIPLLLGERASSPVGVRRF
jgi:hypothetical protein